MFSLFCQEIYIAYNVSLFGQEIRVYIVAYNVFSILSGNIYCKKPHCLLFTIRNFIWLGILWLGILCVRNLVHQEICYLGILWLGILLLGICALGILWLGILWLGILWLVTLYRHWTWQQIFLETCTFSIYFLFYINFLPQHCWLNSNTNLRYVKFALCGEILIIRSFDYVPTTITHACFYHCYYLAEWPDIRHSGQRGCSLLDRACDTWGTKRWTYSTSDIWSKRKTHAG